MKNKVDKIEPKNMRFGLKNKSGAPCNMANKARQQLYVTGYSLDEYLEFQDQFYTRLLRQK